jgi:hypothetical protein
MMDAGTGLGLSIVRRITQALGGNVEVQSAVSVGTTVRVNLPLKISEKTAQDTDTFNTPLQQGLDKDLAGLRVSIVGFEDSVAESTTDLGWNTFTSERDSISTVCRGWLGLQLVEIPDIQDKVPHVVLCDERSLDRAKSLTQRNKSTSLVVVCRNAVVARRLEAASKANDDSAGSEQAVLFTHRP